LGARHFLPENICVINVQNARILRVICPKKKQNSGVLHDNCPKNIFPIFFREGGGHVPLSPSPTLYVHGYADGTTPLVPAPCRLSASESAYCWCRRLAGRSSCATRQASTPDWRRGHRGSHQLSCSGAVSAMIQSQPVTSTVGRWQETVYRRLDSSPLSRVVYR